MKSFKQWLFEKVIVVKSQMFKMTFPVSIGARNINVARAELDKMRHESKVLFDDEIRGVLDTKSNKFYIWYGEDTVHSDLQKIFKINDRVEFDIAVKAKSVNVRTPGFIFKEDDAHYLNTMKLVKSFFWSTAEYRGAVVGDKKDIIITGDMF